MYLHRRCGTGTTSFPAHSRPRVRKISRWRRQERELAGIEAAARARSHEAAKLRAEEAAVSVQHGKAVDEVVTHVELALAKLARLVDGGA
jgi:hypothetical protein